MFKDKDSIIYGIRPVIEAIKAGKEIDKILIQNGLKSENLHELREMIRLQDIPFQYVPIEKLNRVTSKNHQGIIGYISEVEYQKIENVLPMVYESGKDPLILILDRITDVRNIGAIARTAECTGVDAIVIPLNGSAKLNGDAVKTSCGALLKIPVCRSSNLKETIEFLKESGLRIVSCTEKTDNLYTQADYTGPVAVIMGSEEDGISGEYLKRSDYKVKLPMFGEIESLNVSVATGVILYEVIRQRKI
jgi:23S rRNA (guanosine2251-2'-O)-methyltransferase